MVQQIDLNKKPHLIDAIIGNSRMLASLGKTGRIYRLWWPHIDFPQHIDELRTGLRLLGANGEPTSWFDSEEQGWTSEARYEDGTNIIRIRSKHPEFPIAVRSTLFAVPGQDALVRHYQLTNQGNTPSTVQFVQYSSLHIAESPYYQNTYFDENADALIHYRANYAFAFSASASCSAFQVREAKEAAHLGQLNGREIDMVSDGALAWTLPEIRPGETIALTLYLAAGDSTDHALQELAAVRAVSYTELYDNTAAYWNRFLRSAKPCPIREEPIQSLYERSLLVMKLMSDERTGALLAAPEMDEAHMRCGGYGYCWGRDAAFITTALDAAGLTQLSAHFFQWALTAQDESGAWQQRHLHDGSLAPSWGLQIDEGASILWGLWRHYETTGNTWVLGDDVWHAVAKGAEFLIRRLDKETGLPLPSHDLWEERVAKHTYSSAAVYGGLRAAAQIAEARGERALAETWRNTASRVQDSIALHCWNEQQERFYRGLKLNVTEEHYRAALQAGASGHTARTAKGYEKFYLSVDPIVDVSLLGVAHPFAVVSAHDERMAKTADAIHEKLWVKGVGGIKRYEDDPYIGGNPWILTTLWLAQYRVVQNRIDEANALLQWAVDHRTKLGLLPEQIDKVTGETAWVVPLTWSHAMFVLTVWMMAEARHPVSR